MLNAINPTLPVSLATLQANDFVEYSIVLVVMLPAILPLIALITVAGGQPIAGII